MVLGSSCITHPACCHQQLCSCSTLVFPPKIATGKKWRQHSSQSGDMTPPFFKIILLISLLILSLDSSLYPSSSFSAYPSLHLPSCFFTKIEPSSSSSSTSVCTLSSAFAATSPLPSHFSLTVSSSQDHSDTAVISHQLRRRPTTES